MLPVPNKLPPSNYDVHIIICHSHNSRFNLMVQNDRSVASLGSATVLSAKGN